MPAPRRLTALAALTALAVAAPVGAPVAAQTPTVSVGQSVPPPKLDTVIVSAFSLANGATFTSAPMDLTHALIGKAPSHYRASTDPLFRGATWRPYARPLPGFSGSPTGACGTGTMRVVVFFQVRAPRTLGEANTYVHSNVARDTTCVTIGG